MRLVRTIDSRPLAHAHDRVLGLSLPFSARVIVVAAQPLVFKPLLLPATHLFEYLFCVQADYIVY